MLIPGAYLTLIHTLFESEFPMKSTLRSHNGISDNDHKKNKIKIATTLAAHALVALILANRFANFFPVSSR